MDVDDMPTTVREAARILGPGGRLRVCVTHPLNDAGLVLELLREPEPPLGLSDDEKWSRIPLFLHLRARKS
jgi:ubiquinone/menaquinone biosynthesis C-methylase UbiE